MLENRCTGVLESKKSELEPEKPSPPAQKCVDCTVMEDVDMIVITDNSESVQKDQLRSEKLQVLKAEFFSEWYSGNNVSLSFIKIS